MQHPLGVLFHKGLIYVADTYNHKIKLVDPTALSCKTILGTREPGKLYGKTVEFYEPSGLTIAKGKLYIADTNNHAIKVADINSGELSTLEITGF